MLLTDTDTLMYKIKADNIHEDFYKNKELFGFSNYPKDSKYYNNANNLVVGRMIKHTPRLWKASLGYKSEMYFFIIKDIHESKKTRDINQNVVPSELKYLDCKYILFNRSYMRHEMYRIIKNQ